MFAQVRRRGFNPGPHYPLPTAISYVLGEDTNPDSLVTASTGGYVVSDG